MKERLIVTTVVVGGIVLAVGATLAFAGKPGGGGTSTANYPDLRAVVPAHVQLVNQQQRETLRFSNGIANTGGGPWAMRPENELGTTPTTTAFQEIRSSNAQYQCGTQPKQVQECYDVLHDQAVSVFEYHPTHNHWHTADAALFEIRQGGPGGSIVSSQSTKVGFCLIEIYRLEANSPTSERTFWDCHGTHQGIGSGWVDQYHQATDGQQVDLTGVDDGTDYYLVSKADPTNAFLETNDSNNSAWVRLTLSGKKTGNRKVTVTGNSECDSPGLCGVGAPNPG